MNPVMASTILLCASMAVLWWPASRPEHRLGRLSTVEQGRGAVSAPGLWSFVVVSGIWLFAGAAAGVSASMVAGHLWRQMRRRGARRRAEAARDDLITGLSVMTAEMSVGAPAALACARAADELADSGDVGRPGTGVAERLATMAGRARLGGSVDEAGTPRAGDVSPIESDWDRVAGAWSASDTHGVPMLELLEAVRRDMVARREFQARTRAALAGPRATATVLAGLPVLGIALGQATGAAPLSVLLGGGWGGTLLMIGTAALIVGLVWSQRIADRVQLS